MEFKGSLPCTQGSKTGFCPKPDESNLLSSLSLRYILILSNLLTLSLGSGLLTLVFPNNFCKFCWFIPCVLHVQPFSFFISSPEWCFVIIVKGIFVIKFFYASACWFFLGPKIILSTPLSDVPNICYFLYVRTSYPHADRTTGKIMFSSV
jgi:hypothetical protein